MDSYYDSYGQEVTMDPYIEPYVSYPIDPLPGSVLSEDTSTSDLASYDPLTGEVFSEDTSTSDLGSYVDLSSGSVPLDNTDSSAITFDSYFADNTDWSSDLSVLNAYDPYFDPSSDSYGFGLLDSSSFSPSDYLDFNMEIALGSVYITHNLLW